MAVGERALERGVAVVTITPLHIWFRLLRHHLRLLAPSSAIWIIGLVAVAMLVSSAYETTMPTEADRQALAISVEGNPAFEAMFGRAISLDTIEGFTMWRAGGPLIPAIVIWGVLVGTRLGRGEEDRGHDELLLGGILSRAALLLSALAALGILAVIYAAATTLGLPLVSAIGLEGSLRFALAMAGGFLTFTALGTLLAQIMPTRSAALRAGLGVVGITLALRMLSVLEAAPDWLPWLTPFGWYAETGTAQIGSNLPFLLFALTTLAFAVGAVMLCRERELHGSRLVTEQESATATRSYRSLWAHQVRQDGPSILGFGAVGVLLSLIFGMVADEFVDFIEGFPAFAEILAAFGLEDPTDPAAYVGLIVTVLVLIPALFAASVVAALRDDEATGRLTVLLVLPIRRVKWLLVNAVVAIAGITLISLVIGFSAMAGTGITGTMLAPLDALRAGLNLIPMAVMFTGMGILVFGLYPPLTGPAVYTVLLASFIVVMMDAFLDIPDWIVSLSPFDHLALVPGEPANLTASAAFLLIGLGSGIIGSIAFRYRDLMMD